MSCYLPADVCDLLMTQVALLVPFLPGYINVTHRGCVEVVLDELTEAPDDVFEGATRHKEVVLMFGVEQSSQGW